MTVNEFIEALYEIPSRDRKAQVMVSLYPNCFPVRKIDWMDVAEGIIVFVNADGNTPNDEYTDYPDGFFDKKEQ